MEAAASDSAVSLSRESARTTASRTSLGLPVPEMRFMLGRLATRVGPQAHSATATRAGEIRAMGSLRGASNVLAY